MIDNEYITIKHEDGNTEVVQVVTYLISEDGLRNYIV